MLPRAVSAVWGERRPDALFTAAVVVVYALLVAVGTGRHEMWRDEAQAWLIVRDVSSLGELFQLLRYEGHPALWYLLLYPLAKYVTHSPAAMQVVHGVIATAAVYVFARFSPFTRMQKVLWCFGYYSLFEYGVISRNYSLGALLLWTLCAIWPRRRQAVLAMATVLALLANTNLFAALLAGSFAIAWIVDAWWDRMGHADPVRASRRARWAMAFVILLAGCASSAATVYPARDAIIRPPDGDLLAIPQRPDPFHRAVRRITDVWRSYVPFPDPRTRRFWRTNVLLLNSPATSAVGALLSLGLAAAAARTLRPSRAALIAYGLATLSIVIAIYVWLPSSNRHIGHLFLAYAACAWIERVDRAPPDTARVARGYFLTAILAAQFIAGAWVMAVDLRHPFSSGDQAARWLASNGLADAAFVGDVAHRYAPLAARLDTRIYFPVRRAWGSYALLDRTSKDATPREVDAACRTLLEGARPVILITGHALTTSSTDLRYEPLAKFTGSVTEESYHLYRVRPPDAR